MKNGVRCWDIIAATALIGGTLVVADPYIRNKAGDVALSMFNAPTTLEASAQEPVTTIRMRPGQGLYSLARECGVAVHDDAILPSANSVLYEAFVSALRDLNPDNFNHRGTVPLAGTYEVPTRLCPSEANK